MDLLKFASQKFLDKIGPASSGLDLNSVSSALQKLLPTKNGQIDLQALVGQFSSRGGLSSLVSSWLGDGKNQPLNTSQVLSVFGETNVKSFSDKLGLDQGTAASGLSEMIPELIDKSSEGGNLLSNLQKKAGGIFQRLFSSSH